MGGMTPGSATNLRNRAILAQHAGEPCLRRALVVESRRLDTLLVRHLSPNDGKSGLEREYVLSERQYSEARK
jgi:hypothetical protein